MQLKIDYFLAFFMPSSVQISNFAFDFRESLKLHADKLPLNKVSLQAPYNNHINANEVMIFILVNHSPLYICIVNT